jgi:nucleotide-binding universal stress UspA family protein
MTEERDRIVVGVDGSLHGLAAARWALDEACHRQADVELVCCRHAPYMAETSGHAMAYVSPEEMTAQSTQVLADTLSALAPDITRARDEGCRVETQVLEGPPGPVLVAESKGAAMVVVGRRGHGALVRLLLGSVSRYVMLHATCPVVVLGVPD